MPVEPVMTPAERSNSPPIINRATATAMMPSGAAPSSHEADVAAVENFSLVAQKSAQTMMVPMRAPISGEISMRCMGPRNEILSSRCGTAPWTVALSAIRVPPCE